MPSARAKAEELERLLAGGSMRDDTPAELANLLTLASSVEEHTAVPRPSAEFRVALRERLLEEAETVVPLSTRAKRRLDDATTRWRNSARTAVASAMASTMIGTAGMAVAAQSALPGDLLYELKRGTESVRVTFAVTDVEEGRLYLAFARERLEEVESLVTDRRVTDVAGTLEDMDEASIAGANLLLQAAALSNADEMTSELQQFAASQRTRLLLLADALPIAEQPAVEQSLEVLRRIEIQAGLVLGADCDLCGADNVSADGPPRRVSLPGEGPAATTSCDCVGDDPNPAPRDTTVVGNDSLSSGDNTSDDPDRPSGDEPSGDDGGAIGDVTDPVDDAVDTTTDVVDDLASDLGIDDELSDLESTVEDEVIDPIEDLLPSDDPLDLSSTVDDTTTTLDGTTSTLDGATSTVDDTTSSLTEPITEPLPTDDPTSGLLGQ